MTDQHAHGAAGADVSVRPAAPADADRLGVLQADAWRRRYAEPLPAEVLVGFEPAAFAATWQAAIMDPPSPRHRVLVACERAHPVGLAAQGPAADPDLSAETDAELLTLVVDLDVLGRGHGSRLLAAVADTMRADGFTTAVTWLLDAAADDALRSFLVGAGWAPDGARRDLDVDGGLLRQIRLHTDLTPAGGTEHA